MSSRGLLAIDDDLLGCSMEHAIALRAGRNRAEFANLWRGIDMLLDERLERMTAKDDCDSEVSA